MEKREMPIFGGKKDKKNKAVVAIETLLNEADAHLKSGDLDKAASEYRRGHRYLYREENIANNPEGFSALFTKTGHGLFETGEPDRAVECFDKATQLNPKNTDAWMSRGIVHMKSGAMLNYAVMCFDEVLKYEENNLEAMENKVEALLLSKKEDDAVEVLENMVEIAPDNDAFRKKLDELSPADLETITNKLKSKPRDAVLWRKRAQLLEEDGNTAEAIEAYLRLGYLAKDPKVYETVLELNPNNMTALDKLIEFRPDDVGLLERKAAALISEEKNDEAAGIYEKLTGIVPDSEDYKTKLTELRPTEEVLEPESGRVVVEESAQEIAVEASPVPTTESEPVVEDAPIEETPAEEVTPEPMPLSEMDDAGNQSQTSAAASAEDADPWAVKIAADPNNSTLHNEAGDYYFENENYETALGYFTRAVEIVPLDTVALHNKGSVQFVLEAYDDAIVTFDQLIAIDSNDIDAYLTKGAAYFKSGRYDDSIEALNNVVKREMSNAAAWYYKSLAEAMKGNLKLVVPFLTRSVDIEEEFRGRAKTDPSFDKVRDTPEFQAIVNK